MRKLLPAVLLAAAASAAFDYQMPDDELFEQFLVEFDKHYSPEERAMRFNRFREVLAFIRRHNAEGRSFEVGINHFSDWTEEELRQRNGFRPAERTSSVAVDLGATAWDEDFLDWRTPELNPANVTAVTVVKNQGSCGSCWAFAVCASIEGNVAIQSGGVLNDLSTQELVDCDTVGQAGCDGGNFPSAFAYAKKYGISSYLDYPYKGKEGECRADEFEPVSAIQGQVYLRPCDDDAMYQAVKMTPVTIGLDASCNAFQSYKSGIYDHDCGFSINHAVVVVGYGVQDGVPYYILKNSWGAGWGEDGYMRIKRKPKSCGVSGMLIQPAIPTGGYALTNESQLLDLDDDYFGDDDDSAFDFFDIWGWIIIVAGVCLLVTGVYYTAKYFQQVDDREADLLRQNQNRYNRFSD